MYKTGAMQKMNKGGGQSAGGTNSSKQKARGIELSKRAIGRQSTMPRGIRRVRREGASHTNPKKKKKKVDMKKRKRHKKQSARANIKRPDKGVNIYYCKSE